MPVTPVTAALFDSAYVQDEYPLLAQRLRATHSEADLSAAVLAHTQQPECENNRGTVRRDVCVVLSVIWDGDDCRK